MSKSYFGIYFALFLFILGLGLYLVLPYFTFIEQDPRTESSLDSAPTCSSLNVVEYLKTFESKKIPESCSVQNAIDYLKTSKPKTVSESCPVQNTIDYLKTSKPKTISENCPVQNALEHLRLFESKQISENKVVLNITEQVNALESKADLKNQTNKEIQEYVMKKEDHLSFALSLADLELEHFHLRDKALLALDIDTIQESSFFADQTRDLFKKEVSIWIKTSKDLPCFLKEKRELISRSCKNSFAFFYRIKRELHLALQTQFTDAELFYALAILPENQKNSKGLTVFLSGLNSERVSFSYLVLEAYAKTFAEYSESAYKLFSLLYHANPYGTGAFVSIFAIAGLVELWYLLKLNKLVPKIRKRSPGKDGLKKQNKGPKEDPNEDSNGKRRAQFVMDLKNYVKNKERLSFSFGLEMRKIGIDFLLLGELPQDMDLEEVTLTPAEEKFLREQEDISNLYPNVRRELAEEINQFNEELLSKTAKKKLKQAKRLLLEQEKREAKEREQIELDTTKILGALKKSRRDSQELEDLFEEEAKSSTSPKMEIELKDFEVRSKKETTSKSSKLEEGPIVSESGSNSPRIEGPQEVTFGKGLGQVGDAEEINPEEEAMVKDTSKIRAEEEGVTETQKENERLRQVLREEEEKRLEQEIHEEEERINRLKEQGDKAEEDEFENLHNLKEQLKKIQGPIYLAGELPGFVPEPKPRQRESLISLNSEEPDQKRKGSYDMNLNTKKEEPVLTKSKSLPGLTHQVSHTTLELDPIEPQGVEGTLQEIEKLKQDLERDIQTKNKKKAEEKSFELKLDEQNQPKEKSETNSSEATSFKSTVTKVQDTEEPQIPEPANLEELVGPESELDQEIKSEHSNVESETSQEKIDKQLEEPLQQKAQNQQAQELDLKQKEIDIPAAAAQQEPGPALQDQENKAAEDIEPVLSGNESNKGSEQNSEIGNIQEEELNLELEDNQEKADSENKEKIEQPDPKAEEKDQEAQEIVFAQEESESDGEIEKAGSEEAEKDNQEKADSEDEGNQKEQPVPKVEPKEELALKQEDIEIPAAQQQGEPAEESKNAEN